MFAAAYLTEDEERAQLRRRLIALLIVVGVHVLLVLALIFLAKARLLPAKLTPDLQIINLLPPSDPAREPMKRRVNGGAKHAAKTVSKPLTTKLPPAPSRIVLIPGAETFDLAKTTPDRSLTQTADAGAGTGEGTDNGSATGKGGGPHGETLYAAEWVREPTDAEMRTYLPRNIPEDAWAEIACRTIPGFRVEDCEELDESPRGSQLARALRQAAWQFRVRPKRSGANLMVGSWVSIHFSFTRKPGSDPAAP
jgi:protein TonB